MIVATHPNTGSIHWVNPTTQRTLCGRTLTLDWAFGNADPDDVTCRACNPPLDYDYDTDEYGRIIFASRPVERRAAPNVVRR